MKAVIIGSGLGGLSCGAILAKCGYEVTVLEKEAVIGGCLQCFERARGLKQVCISLVVPQRDKRCIP